MRWTAPSLGNVMGLMPSRTHSRFESDVMVEADAQLVFDARPVLSRIPVSVLLVDGDEDSYLPIPLIEATARLIPDRTLVIHPGREATACSTMRCT